MGAIYYKICIDSYDIYLLECFTSPLSLSLGSTVAIDLLRGNQLSDGRHSTVTHDTMWSTPEMFRSVALMIGLQQRRMNRPSRAWRMSTECNRRRSVAATFIEQSLAGDATII